MDCHECKGTGKSTQDLGHGRGVMLTVCGKCSGSGKVPDYSIRSQANELLTEHINPKPAYIFFRVLFIAMFLYSVWSLISTYSFTLFADSTQGVVTSEPKESVSTFVQKTGLKEPEYRVNTYHYETMDYEFPVNGKTYHGRATKDDSGSREGSPVTVYYRHSNPEDSRLHVTDTDSAWFIFAFSGIPVAWIVLRRVAGF